MPGIAGIIGRNFSEEFPPMLQRMVGSLIHEPSHSAAACFNRRLGLAAGLVGNSVDTLTHPLWSKTEDVCLIFSGQIFNGHPGMTQAEHVIQLYETFGLACLEKLNGWFSGLLLDLKECKVILFNDRYGLGRIYYHENPKGFFFSSEAKSLLNVIPSLRQLDEPGLAEWFSCGCPLQNRTLFKGISLLPPGSSWIFSTEGRVDKRAYFKPQSWENLPVLAPAEYEARLQETFPRILRRYLGEDEAVGMSLTGGLDGRMIMAWSPRARGTLPCYTFNGPIRDCADVKIARRIARACGQPHHTISVGDDFLVQFEKLAAKTVYLSDGAMDVTGAVELYVNQQARQIAPIRLTGNYGSEILRRHVAFKPRIFPAEILGENFSRLTGEAAQSYSEETQCHPLSFIAFKQVPWHHFSRLAVEQSQLTVRSPFLDNDLVALAFQGPSQSATTLEPSLRLIAAGKSALARIPTDRGVIYPAGGKFINSLRKSFYDHVSALRLENLFLGRQKFCHFRSWYRDKLNGPIKDILLGSRSYVRSRFPEVDLETRIGAHLKGTGNSTMLINKLLSLELLHGQLIRGDAFVGAEDKVFPGTTAVAA